MKRVVLLHGNGGGTGKDNWFPYIQEGLSKIRVECIAPDLPDSTLARAKYWLPYFSETLKLGENDIVVGHSSGALAILKYAEENKLAGSVLAGTYYTDLGYEDERTSGYFDTPWDWDAIKSNQSWTAIFASPDDPYIPINEPKYIRDKLGSDYFELPGEGHFGGSEARVKLEFPELLGYLVSRLKMAAPSGTVPLDITTD
jgi:uncharacterized protein